MAKVNIKIDGQDVICDAGSTILEAAQSAGIYIPTLCYHSDLIPDGVCRVCSVEVKGQRTLCAACCFPVSDGMEVMTHTPKVREARRMIVELMLANHPGECLTCSKNQKCELQKFAKELGISDIRFKGERRQYDIDASSPIIRDPDKCILCGRCVRTCDDIQSVGALHPAYRGWETLVVPGLGGELADVVCVNCGQCINRCPTGALKAKDPAPEIWEAIYDPTKHVIVQTAPAVRASIGEEFGLPPGTRVTKKMVTALKMLGFDRVMDTDFTADLTIMEEGSELIKRIKEGGVLPQITSCSPGWIKFIEYYYPELLPHVSTCKSPQQMFGALAKTYYAQKMNIDPKNIVSVSIMPCTAKKFECERPEMYSSGYKDVDYVLTTREAAGMMKEAGIDLPNLRESEYDDPFGMSTGAAVIFGNTGGVMEAALRTAYALITGRELEKVEIEDVRGMEGVRETTIQIGDLPVKAAVAHGLANARQVLEGIKSGRFADYAFIEIMCCPGGCIGGGGQPQPTNEEIRKARARAIYEEDESMTIRKSHENPAVQKLYEEFLGHPLSHKSHELLHTHYTPRERRTIRRSEETSKPKTTKADSSKKVKVD
ncbi:MAG: NADH-dependent [FeFe] hydrogenase, group A6 [Armatimonadetes bacterium]|nr:NADH-dependent [FeFe] hydrogenase, group A6 [Armatimonadota bacterium]